MRAVIQRVREASLSIENKEPIHMKSGLVVLLGIAPGDDSEDIQWLLKKITNLRIFADDDGKMNDSIREINGTLMIVSQFTLYASTKKGNRPSWTNAAGPKEAVPLYAEFIETAKTFDDISIIHGKFGAHMDIRLTNDGPVTLIIDSKNKE